MPDDTRAMLAKMCDMLALSKHNTALCRDRFEDGLGRYGKTAHLSIGAAYPREISEEVADALDLTVGAVRCKVFDARDEDVQGILDNCADTLARLERLAKKVRPHD